MIAADQPSNFKVIYSILNPPLMGYNTGNGVSLQKLPDKITNFKKKMLEIEIKESKILNTFRKLLE